MSALSHDIFSNIPERDFLALLDEGEARAAKVIEFIGFSSIFI